MDPVCIKIYIFCGLFFFFENVNNCYLLGKSNFMDAISFVMGEKTNCLRVKRLSELIHGAAIGRPVSNRCFVTAKFELPDGTKIDFQRSVIGSSADYKINGKVCRALVNIIRNCVVFVIEIVIHFNRVCICRVFKAEPIWKNWKNWELM